MPTTNRGRWLMYQWVFRGVSLPTNFYAALITPLDIVTVDSTTMSEFTEIAAGNGYTAGGYSLARNTTDFKSNTENYILNQAELLIKDVAWTATGGPIPASSYGARFLVLTTDEATLGDRQIVAFWDLASDRSITVGQTLKFKDLGITAKDVTP